VARALPSPRKNGNQMRLWDAEAAPAFWQPRYYDLNVFSRGKYVEKLRYIHPQSSEAGAGEIARIVTMEQLSILPAGGIGGREDYELTRSGSRVHRGPPFAPGAEPSSRSPQRMGHPQCGVEGNTQNGR
jgi:hypothetical protein